MSQENQITLRGYLTAEPKFYQKTQEATPLAEIRIGSTPRRLNRQTGEWQELPTSYYNVKCWRRLAINAASSLHKGDMVIVRGRFYTNTWIDNQQRARSTLEIEADTIGHDLAYGWSHFMRGTRPSGNSEAVNAGEMARQETGTADHDGFGPDPAANEPDERETAALPPDDPDGARAEAGSWNPGSGDGSPAGAGDAQAAAGDQFAESDGDTPEPGSVPEASGVTPEIDSLVRDVNALEREAIPF